MIVIFSFEIIEKNPVLDFYVSKIEDEIIKIGKKTERITSKDIEKFKNINLLAIITVDAKAFWHISNIFKNTKHAIWFQGIMPEEVYLSRKNPFYWLYWSFLEFYAYLKSTAVLVVSDDMKMHYINKYGSKKNIFIAPCINRTFNASKIKSRNYRELKFVYAGSMNKWQEVDRVLELFNEINKTRKATLTIYTLEKEKASNLVQLNRNIQIKSVNDSELDIELQNYTYGFVLRRPSAINKVSTPTKISTYLASGVIPVMTDSIGFLSKLDNLDIKLPILPWKSSLGNWKEKIIEVSHSYDDGLLVCQRIYDTLYSRDEISLEIKSFIDSLIGEL